MNEKRERQKERYEKTIKKQQDLISSLVCILLIQDEMLLYSGFHLLYPSVLENIKITLETTLEQTIHE